MQAHAFILHLTRARGRRENAHALLKNCGLPGEIWAAVDGKALEPEDLTSEVATQLFLPTYPFALKPGEIGCFMSHRQIWAEIVRRDLDHALVLEDDVSLDADVFPKALALAARNVATYGYVQLQNRPAGGPARLIDQEGPCRLTLPTVAPVRASAQLISREAAAQLLERAHRFDRPVDTYVQSHWHTGLRPAVVYPAGVSTISDKLDGSTIQTGRKGLGERLWREAARFVYRRNLARYSRQSPAPVPDDIEGTDA